MRPDEMECSGAFEHAHVWCCRSWKVVRRTLGGRDGTLAWYMQSTIRAAVYLSWIEGFDSASLLGEALRACGRGCSYSQAVRSSGQQEAKSGKQGRKAVLVAVSVGGRPWGRRSVEAWRLVNILCMTQARSFIGKVGTCR